MFIQIDGFMELTIQDATNAGYEKGICTKNYVNQFEYPLLFLVYFVIKFLNFFVFLTAILLGLYILYISAVEYC